MKTLRFVYLFLIILLLTGCSNPAKSLMQPYEHALIEADSLARSGAADSASAVRLIAHLHTEYKRAQTESDGHLVRIAPPNKARRWLFGCIVGVLVALQIWLSAFSIKQAKERKHRQYLVNLSKNEACLHQIAQGRSELEEYLKEMSMSEEEREEIHQSLNNLIDIGQKLDKENRRLKENLKEYEQHPLPQDMEELEAQRKQIASLNALVDALTATLIDRDELIEQLHRQPKYLNEAQWKHLRWLADRVYDRFTQRLGERFPQLTPSDLQLCLLMRLRFGNSEIAALTAVSPPSVSQQKFRLKKRLMQTQPALFDNGATLESVICS
ncbi:MAG: helix-turn-helix transcriptional regulator [Bacteroides sp.]